MQQQSQVQFFHDALLPAKSHSAEQTSTAERVFCADEVLSFAEAVALEYAETGQQRRLFQTAFNGLQAIVNRTDYPPPFISLPLFVYASILGEHRPAIPLSGATTLLFLGIDITDDLADHDLPVYWEEYDTGEIGLTATTLLCSLPQLIIAGLRTTPSVISDMQRTIAEGLLKMAAGQHKDLCFRGRSLVSPSEVEASVAGKSGEELAMFAKLAALFAEAEKEVVNAYADFGRAAGTAAQLTSDCFDIFQAENSRDLGNGTRTLPLAIHLERLRDRERVDFVALLDRARECNQAREHIRKALIGSGTLRKCAFIVELYCQKALRSLEMAGPAEPGRSMLMRLLDDISFFPKGGDRR